ncbi:hypothetical protein I302_107298 [Kwoniella bestiolae CBS 10118]|uniref:Mitochondrial chaperone BCS1-like ATPase lid domain-containing protein n=1 Tax=Kwoniella bestiolae CBS 10118 TaxID=1296100 RepID=A0AAJ8MBX1_9TREE
MLKSRDQIPKINLLFQLTILSTQTSEVSVSSLQGYLMRYKRDPIRAVEEALRWVESGFGQGPTITLKEGKVELKDLRAEV